MSEIIPFSKAECHALRLEAEAGKIPPLEAIRRFVAATRISFLAAEAKQKAKKPEKAVKATEDEVKDFF